MDKEMSDVKVVLVLMRLGVAPYGGRWESTYAISWELAKWVGRMRGGMYGSS